MECKDCEYRPELCYIYGSNPSECPLPCFCCKCQLFACPYLQEEELNSDDLPF